MEAITFGSDEEVEDDSSTFAASQAVVDAPTPETPEMPVEDEDVNCHAGGVTKAMALEDTIGWFGRVSE